MKEEKFFNILEGFDFSLLENPEFQEDSVREEILVPIIKGLGYSANKPNQIIRSRKLLHPFVSIGSKRKEIYIIPDYLFEIDGKPAWILDAKSPKEQITKSHHVEQAYSYAVHSEVRVDLFALCNGKDFAIFNIKKVEPILQFPLIALPLYWDNLKNILSPEKLVSEDSLKFAKDLGLHLKRLGFDTFKSLIFPNVPITNIGQIDPDMFSLSGGVRVDDTSYVVTFDFDKEVFKQLVGKIPNEVIKELFKRENNHPKIVNFADRRYYITIDCKIGNKLEENEYEIFQPLIINRIID